MSRYTRNILIDGLGEEGQQKIKKSKILVIGAGGLGSPVLLYLAAAGIGTLGIIDYDKVDMTNLQRQILHYTSDMDRLKVDSAGDKLHDLNPEVNFRLYAEKFTAENAAEFVRKYDFIIDCSDNYQTKFLINDICVREGKAYSHGAVIALRGEVMTYKPGHACYRCVFDAPPANETVETSSQVGILGSIAGVIGCIQATEAIKYITDIGDLLTDRLLVFDGKEMSFYSLQVEKTLPCICQSMM